MSHPYTCLQLLARLTEVPWTTGGGELQQAITERDAWTFHMELQEWQRYSWRSQMELLGQIICWETMLRTFCISPGLLVWAKQINLYDTRRARVCMSGAYIRWLRYMARSRIHQRWACDCIGGLISGVGWFRQVFRQVDEFDGPTQLAERVRCDGRGGRFALAAGTSYMQQRHCSDGTATLAHRRAL